MVSGLVWAMCANFYGKYVNHGAMVYYLFITNVRGYQNSPKDRAYSDREKMTSKLLFFYWKLGMS